MNTVHLKHKLQAGLQYLIKSINDTGKKQVVNKTKSTKKLQSSQEKATNINFYLDQMHRRDQDHLIIMKSSC